MERLIELKKKQQQKTALLSWFAEKKDDYFLTIYVSNFLSVLVYKHR